MTITVLKDRRVEIDTSDRRVDRIRFFDHGIDRGERLAPDEFHSREWARRWLHREVNDPSELRWFA